MTRSRKLTLGAISIGVLGAAIYGVTTANGASTNIDPSRLATVERGPMVRSVVATGKVEPITKVEIKSKANGIIERLAVDVDHLVDAGEILAVLDKENLTARLREARANLEAARAAETAAEAQAKKHEIEAESPDVEFAKSAYDRARSLNEQQLVSQESLDQAKTLYDQALNRQRAAASQALIGRAKVNEAQAQAAVERADEELANATIKAPIRGTVLTRDVEIGSPVSSILNLGANASLVMTIGDIEKVFVRGRVDEADIGVVTLGMPARITTESFKDKVFNGKVTQISPIGVEKDNVTTFEVEVSIDNFGQELKANMTANAEILLEERPDTLIVPEAAIFYDEKKNASVDVADPAAEKGLRRVPIRVGIGNGTRTEVLEGLAEGDRVVLPG